MGIFICLSILYIVPALIGLIPFIFFNQAVLLDVTDSKKCTNSQYICSCITPMVNWLFYVGIIVLLFYAVINKIDNLRLSINNTRNKSKINYKKENHESRV